MQYRQFSKWLLLTTIVVLTGIAALIYLIDPFLQYHLPFFGLNAVFNRGTQSYSNPGLAKNYDYESVVLGSSVSENFRASWFDDAFNTKTLKLPYAGAWSRTYEEIMKVIFNRRSPRYVFFSVDQFGFQGDASNLRYELPNYLYDTNPFNDVKYLLNKEIFPEIINMIQYSASDSVVPFDDAYSWQHEHVFSEERTLSLYKRQPQAAEFPADFYQVKVKENLDNILPFIENHPETEFYFFFPPYSILTWDHYRQIGQLDATLEMTRTILNTLLRYDNVRVFYFQNAAEIINDLNLYREMMHFTEDLNKWMVDCFVSGEYRVFPNEVDQAISSMKEIVLAFDFDEKYGKK